MVNKPPVSLWIATERKAHGWKVEELSRRLKDAGYEAEVPTIRVWEAGRSPHPDTIEALERMFGSRAPRETPVSTDAGLAQMIAAQTEVLREIRDLLADLRGSAPSTDIRRLEAVVGEEARASLESRLEAEDGPATGAREGELQRTP